MADTIDEARLKTLGVTDAQLNTMKKRPHIASAVLTVAEELGLTTCDEATASQIVTLASTLPERQSRFLPIVGKYIVEGKIKTNPQLNGAIGFLKKVADGEELDVAAFEAACGAGVDVTQEEVDAAVAAVIAEHKEELVENRYRFSIAKLLGKLREGRMQWADGKATKETLDKAILALLGPKTEADMAKPKAKKTKAKKEKGPKTPKEEEKKEEATWSLDSFEDAFRGRELVTARNSKELIEEHRAITGGVVRTRFPPEPNGYLHIGHAKSMCLNFEGAFEAVGAPQDKRFTYHRYDDTNPEVESQEYIDSQADNVAWMGWKPARVTFSSDYFDKLHELAIRLIKEGKAYVCHQSKADMEVSRDIARSGVGNPNSPWRDRSVEENLKEFENMRKGKYAEGMAAALWDGMQSGKK